MQQAQVLVQKDVPWRAVIGCSNNAKKTKKKCCQKQRMRNKNWHRSAAHMPLWLQAMMTSRGTHSL
jgi:hypothetical protein